MAFTSRILYDMHIDRSDIKRGLMIFKKPCWIWYTEAEKLPGVFRRYTQMYLWGRKYLYFYSNFTGICFFHSFNFSSCICICMYLDISQCLSALLELYRARIDHKYICRTNNRYVSLNSCLQFIVTYPLGLVEHNVDPPMLDIFFGLFVRYGVPMAI